MNNEYHWNVLRVILKSEIERPDANLVWTLPEQFGGWIRATVPDQVLAAIEQLPEMVDRKNSRIHHSHGSYSLQTIDVGNALIQHSVSSGIEDALGKLKSFFDCKFTTYSEIALLGGISVVKRIALIPGLYLCPPEDIPIDEFQQAHAESKAAPKFSKRKKFDYSDTRIATAALIRQNCRAARFETELGPYSIPAPIIHLIVPLLALAGPSCPIMYRKFGELDDSEFLKPSTPEGFAWNDGDTRVTESIEVTDEDFVGFPELFSKFVALPEKDRIHLSVSLYRLNESIRHRTPVDKALDLGIALESVFLSGKRVTDQLSFQFRLRGAWLLGKTELERHSLLKELGHLYELRSQAAHNGSLSGHHEKIAGDLKIGQRLCADAITKVISHGCFPDWTTLILGAGYVPQPQ